MLRATPAADEEQSFGTKAWEQADHYTAAFSAGDEGETEEEEEPRSP